MFLKTKIIKDLMCLEPYGIEFISKIIFMFTKRMFLVDETVIYENEPGDELFYINNGKVGLFHKASKTFVCNCTNSQYFGEIAFFTGRKRTLTVKSRDYTDVQVLDFETFMSVAVDFPVAMNAYHDICDELITGSRNYSSFKVKCYVCKLEGHISVDCPGFISIKSNLMKAKGNTNLT